MDECQSHAKTENWLGHIFMIQAGMFLIPILYKWYIDLTHKEQSSTLFRILAVIAISTTLCESIYLFKTVEKIGVILSISCIVLNALSLSAGDSIKIGTNENLKSKNQAYEQ